MDRTRYKRHAWLGREFGRSLSFFVWIVIDLAAWAAFAWPSLIGALEGKPMTNDPIGRLLFVLVACFVLSALNNMATPVRFARRRLRQASEGVDRFRLAAGFLGLAAIKIVVGCIALYVILANVSPLFRDATGG